MVRLKWLHALCAILFFSVTATAQQYVHQILYQENFDEPGQAQTLLKVNSQPSGDHFTATQSKRLSLSQILLPQTDVKLVLSFQSRFEQTREYGIGHVRVSTDDGKTWQLLHAVDGVSDWQRAGADLSPFSGESILLQFESIRLTSGKTTPWHIDDIVVAEMEPEANLAAAGVLDVNIKSLNASLFPLIFMNVTVDTNGAALPDLKQADFVVCENDTPQTDLFQVTPPGSAGGSRLADIVFIVDNSGSLGDEQQAVNDNMIAFVDSLAASGVDFALGLCRYGASQNSGNPIIEDNGQLTTDAAYFKNNVWARNVINGFSEPGYFAIVQSATQFNFRPGAQRIFIIITDERADQGGATQQDAINSCLNNSITVYALIDQFFINNNSDLTVVAQQTGGKAFNITDPFNTILEDIQGAVSNTYVVRYRSSRPVIDGVERIVKVVATHNAESDSAFGKYTPGANPIIRRDSSTIALSHKAQQQGTVFTITAIITDAAAPFTQSATLFYRTTNSANYTSTPMVKQTVAFSAKVNNAGAKDISQKHPPESPFEGGLKNSPLKNHRLHSSFENRIIHSPLEGGQGGVTGFRFKTNLNLSAGDSSTWVATIPGSFAKQPGVDYYITATDGITTTSAPETNAQTSPFQIAVLPNEPPSVAHTPPANYQPGVAFDVNATVIDSTNNLASVTLNYRKVGDILFRSIPMSKTGSNNYKETIPAASLTQSGIEYFIRATDDFGVATIKFFTVLPIQAPAAIVVLQPNGGEKWQVCSLQFVKWSANNVSTVKIEYSLDGGTSWTTLVDKLTEPSGQFSWAMPSNLTANALVRISDASNAQITDASDSAFEISDFPKFENWQAYHACNSGLIENYIKAIVVDCEGTVFLGTRNSGLLRMDNQGKWLQFATTNSEIPGNSILSLTLQGTELWVGTNGQGLAKFSNNGWKTYSMNNGLPHNRVWALAVDKRLNDVWAGTSNGLAKYNQNGWKVFKDELPNATIFAIAIAQDGRIWIGTADGLLEYNGAIWKHYTFANSGLLDRTVLALALDKAGRVWIGTAKGLNRFDGQNWVSFTSSNSPLPANSVRAIRIDNNDYKWIGTWGGGLSRLGSSWAHYNTTSGNAGLLDDYVISMFIDCNGYKWIGTENGGLAQFKGNPGVPVSVEEDAVSLQPSVFSLEQNYPNPFNPSTVFSCPRTATFSLPSTP
ncbi:MAG: two-component regulator propeller domain-containing protein [bacterium]